MANLKAGEASAPEDKLVDTLFSLVTQPSSAMKIAPTAALPLLVLLLFSPAAMPSALAPSGTDEHSPGVYIVFVSRADYVDSPDYDLGLLASVVGSAAEAKGALLYHYSGVGFAARLAPEHAARMSKKDGVAVLKDETYSIQGDGRLPRFFEENV